MLHRVQVIDIALFVLIRRAQNYDPILKLLLTFGAFLMLEDIQRMLWGAQPYSASEVVNRLGNIEIGDITYTLVDPRIDFSSQGN